MKDSTRPHDAVAARYDGGKIFLSDVDRATDPGEGSSSFESRSDALTGILVALLAKREAQRRGVSEDALYAQEITTKILPVPEAEIVKIYASAERRGDVGPSASFAAFRTDIQRARHDIQEVELRDRFADGLMRAAHVRFNLNALGRKHTQISEGQFPTLGPALAPVEIVEFTSFASPHGKMGAEVIKQLVTKLGGQIRIVFRQMPGDDHANAAAAARAALCAHEQGHYSEYRDELFADQTHLADQDLLAKAKHVGLDPSTFSVCIQSERISRAVADDIAAAKRLDLTGSPEFLLNGMRISGAAPLETFEQLIDKDRNSLQES